VILVVEDGAKAGEITDGAKIQKKKIEQTGS
jgi:hypothetical protein